MKAVVVFTILVVMVLPLAHAVSAPGQDVWEMKANPSLKGATGRLLVKVPTKASMIFQVYKGGEQDPYKHITAWYDSAASNFMPGKYDVKIWDARIDGVPVERGKDTRIRVGVLHVMLDGTYEVYDESKTKKVFGGHAKEKSKIVLPAGTYHVKVKDAFGETVIKDGQVTQF